MRPAVHLRCLVRNRSESIRGIRKYLLAPASPQSWFELPARDHRLAAMAAAPGTWLPPGLTLRIELSWPLARRRVVTLRPSPLFPLPSPTFASHTHDLALPSLTTYCSSLPSL